MKKAYWLVLGIIGIILILALSQTIPCKRCEKEESTPRDALFQVSTFNALLEGLFDGETTISDLQKRGDFGIGTYNSLDGEMVAVEGRFYQVTDTGIADIADSSTKTPFASVTFFHTDQILQLEGDVNYTNLQKIVDEKLPTKNIPYAIKIKGNFSYMKTRAPHKQNKPYPELVDALKDQPIFELNQTEGTLVGFRLPEYVNGINVPGYHMHYIDSSMSSGGHVLEFTINQPVLEIDYKYLFYMSLPDAEEFNKVELSGDKTKEIEEVEK